MPRQNKASSLAGLGVLAILMAPEVGVILAIIAVILIAVLLGMFVVVYVTLQTYHLLTAAVWSIATLLVLYSVLRFGIITQRAAKKHPWLALLPIGAFIFGYIMETGGHALTVVPLSLTSTPIEATSDLVSIFSLTFGALSVVVDLWRIFRK